MSPSQHEKSGTALGCARRSFLGALLFGSVAGIPGSARGESESSIELNVAGESWPTSQYDKSNTGNATTIELTDRPSTTWSRAIDDPRNESSRLRVSPPIRTQRLIVYTTHKAIIARGSADGELIWRQEHPESCHPNTVPVVTDGKVITADTQVTAWELVSGEKLWEVDLASHSVEAPLKTDGDRVYVAASQGLSGSVTALDVATGQKGWSVGMNSRIEVGVAIDDTTVYAVDRGGLLRGIRNGEIILELDFNGNRSPTLESYHFQTPIVHDKGLIIPQTYRPKWDDDNRYNGVFLIDKTSGDIINSQTHSQDIDSAAAVYDSNYIIASSEGKVTSARIDGGVENWSRGLNATVTTGLSVVNDTLICGTNTGSVIGMAADSGQQQWEYSVLSEPISGVIAGQNAIFVTGKNNHVGGIHLDEAVDAKIEVQELIRLFTIAVQHGMSFSEGETQLATASQELQRGNYTGAFEAAKAGVDGEISRVESIQKTIESTRREAIAVNRDTPYNATDIISELDQARSELQRKNIENARQIANQSATRVTEVQSQYENATSEIDRLTESIRQAQQKDIPLGNTSSRLNKSRTALSNGNFEQSTTVANATATELTKRTEHIERYRRKNQEAQELLAEVETQDVKLSAERQKLTQAKRQFEAGHYEEAADQTEETIARISSRGDLIESYREAKDTFEQHQQNAESENIQLIESQRLQRTAQEKFEAEEFETANKKMSRSVETAVTTIETAQTARGIIDTADRFDPIQPFVDALATQFGSQKHVLAAKGAYQDGQYDTALSHGKQARNAQQAARLAVNGGIAMTGMTAYGIYRYDGIDRAAEYLIDNDDLEDITD